MRRFARERFLRDRVRRDAQWPLLQYGEHAASELEFTMDLLAARGDQAPGAGPEAFIRATVKDVVTHEVGHTLGLQHNFRAPTHYAGATERQGTLRRTTDVRIGDDWQRVQHRGVGAEAGRVCDEHDRLV